MESAIREHDRKLILAGRGVLPPDGAGIEQVINAVNGAETDCIFSLLPSPEQELLIQRNSALLNARVWFGCGSVLKEIYMKKQKKESFRDFCAGKCSVTRWDGSREVKNKSFGLYTMYSRINMNFCKNYEEMHKKVDFLFLF